MASARQERQQLVQTPTSTSPSQSVCPRRIGREDFDLPTYLGDVIPHARQDIFHPACSPSHAGSPCIIQTACTGLPSQPSSEIATRAILTHGPPADETAMCGRQFRFSLRSSAAPPSAIHPLGRARRVSECKLAGEIIIGPVGDDVRLAPHSPSPCTAAFKPARRCAWQGLGCRDACVGDARIKSDGWCSSISHHAAA